MTEASLTSDALVGLQASRNVALENLRFYECLYDSIDKSLERDSIGRAMAQKQSFIGAIDAILKNHEVTVPDVPRLVPANDCSDLSRNIVAGDHLDQEERFYNAVLSCMDGIDDEVTIKLLSHHLKAAELAVTAIKATSLQI